MKLKKLEVDLVFVGANPKYVQYVKNLLDDKDKTYKLSKRN